MFECYVREKTVDNGSEWINLETWYGSLRENRNAFAVTKIFEVENGFIFFVDRKLWYKFNCLNFEKKMTCVKIWLHKWLVLYYIRDDILHWHIHSHAFICTHTRIYLRTHANTWMNAQNIFITVYISVI